MQNLFKGLFGALSIAIPFIVIAKGALGFFDGNEYIYRLRSSKMYYLAIIFIFVFYGLTNSKSLPIDSPLSPEMLKPVMKMGVDGTGSGLVSTTITYYMVQIFGMTGGWLISIFALIISVMFTFNISIKDVIITIKTKSNKSKNENLTFKEKMVNLKKSAIDMITDEVDEDTVVKKESKLKNFMSKNKHNEEIVIDSEEDINDKTIKIVGFNKAEDEYLEILEGTQSMSELDVLKENSYRL